MTKGRRFLFSDYNKKVDDNKRGDENKKGKKSGYLIFCDTMRPILRERFKPAPKEMMALLGMQYFDLISMFKPDV